MGHVVQTMMPVRHRPPSGTQMAIVRSEVHTPSVLMKPRRVLVIEDDIANARSLVALLKLEGHEAYYAINGFAGMTVARAFRPEVVILDLGLPGMDGYEVCTHLKQQVKQPKVVVVSGRATMQDRERSKAAGCDAHLAKPADPKQILDLIAE